MSAFYDVDESVLIELLGEDLYYSCLYFFQDFFERKSEIKIIMTRRCFSLFKLFAPILAKKGIYNSYGLIITDKSISYHSEMIKKSLENAANSTDDSISVIVADDIIIYGRTISNTISKIVSFCKSDNYSESVILKHIMIMCVSMNVTNSKLSEAYQKLVLADYYSTQLEWKNYSCLLSSAIKAHNIANTSYVISMILHDYNAEEYNKINQELIQKSAIDISTEELKKHLGVEANLFEVTVGNVYNKYILYSCVRLYYYERYNSIVLSPLVILKDLGLKDMEDLCQFFLKKLENCEIPFTTKLLQSKEGLYSIKLRFLILLLSHEVLKNFCDTSKLIEYNLADCDYEEILEYNFSKELASEFKTICFSSFKVQPVQKMGKRLPNMMFNKFIFKKAMLDNGAAVNNNRASRLEGFSLYDTSIQYTRNVFANFVSFIDNGIASLKSFFSFEDKCFVSRAYPGEQAFRIMTDEFAEFIPLLYQLENIAFFERANSYKLFYDFLEYLLNDNTLDDEIRKKTELLFDYISILSDTKQSIADVYVASNCIANYGLEEKYNLFLLSR